jgi:hypothetical protein
MALRKACKLQGMATPFVAFVDECPVDRAAVRAACEQIWSSATPGQLKSGYSQLAAFHGEPPVIALCPAVKN